MGGRTRDFISIFAFPHQLPSTRSARSSPAAYTLGPRKAEGARLLNPHRLPDQNTCSGLCPREDEVGPAALSAQGAGCLKGRVPDLCSTERRQLGGGRGSEAARGFEYLPAGVGKPPSCGVVGGGACPQGPRRLPDPEVPLRPTAAPAPGPAPIGGPRSLGGTGRTSRPGEVRSAPRPL